MMLSSIPWSPFVCGMLDALYDAKNLYIALEHLSCGTLTMAINQRGPFDEATARFYFANIVCGLDFLHEHGVAHRDLKPDNILMGPDGYLCITDFGAATTKWDDNSYITVGTPCYSTPESIRYPDLYCAPSADWWASGCIIYEMLCRALVRLLL
jgi:serine/threonine protein kinase